jgi:hypothetical protein
MMTVILVMPAPRCQLCGALSRTAQAGAGSKVPANRSSSLVLADSQIPCPNFISFVFNGHLPENGSNP